ncbi:uracil-DNA glycosylase family protein [Edaphobacter modestus]|uniref:Uracil DNA glycosylase superfamily protein n=1 Tax=Edaphobacter modestus TaxID=388466 RepID=A0A4Q7YU44_9BACT|nr:uracil-DNA glycosylase family protein [Edaphobacter modestus]RZU41100.1 uracil DNA glycosylase superfamily protein [Edaphobacter modestus]
MSLLASIARWQEESLAIAPPSGTDRLPAVGGLPGPAFFPEGFGLSHVVRNDHPTIIAIGHNFGCQKYRNEIQSAGREDDKATWRNLDALLLQAGSNPAQCFRTNWFVGLLPGSKQTGRFLRKPDHDYEQACLSLLLKQIQEIKPTAILLLGPEVAGRAHGLIPALTPWRGAKGWIDIDQSTVGHSAHDVEVPAAGVRTNVVALLHPSFGAANQSRRMKNMRVPVTEAEIIRAAMA